MNMISLNNVSKYLSDKLIINNLSMSLEKPVIYGLLGPNGAGKTTTIRLICGITNPEKGMVKRKRVRKKNIGYMPEESGLYMDMSVYDQIQYFAALHAISFDSIKSQIHRLIEGLRLTRFLQYKVNQLSKGNIKKVQFICATIHNPKVLILDEPFGGLDPISVLGLEKELKRLNKQGVCILMSTHRMEQVESLCNHVFILNKGQLIANDLINNLKSKYKRELYQLKTDKKLPEKFIEDKQFVVNSGKENRYEFIAYSKKLTRTTVDEIHRMGITVIELKEVLPTIKEIFKTITL